MCLTFWWLMFYLYLSLQMSGHLRAMIVFLMLNLHHKWKSHLVLPRGQPNRTGHALHSVPSPIHLLKQSDGISVPLLNDGGTRLLRDMQVRTPCDSEEKENLLLMAPVELSNSSFTTETSCNSNFRNYIRKIVTSAQIFL